MAVLITADGNAQDVRLPPNVGMDELIRLVGGLPYVSYEHQLPWCGTVLMSSEQEAPLNKRASDLLGATVYGAVLLVEGDPEF